MGGGLEEAAAPVTFTEAVGRPSPVETPMSPTLISVGHSNHPLEQFLELLRGAGVSALADVRSSPFSRQPHFNGPALAPVLRQADIAYVFLGDQLGGRPRSRALYDDEGRVDYELV